MNDLFKMNDRTNEFDAQDAKNSMAMGILSYLGPLALIPYFAEKNSAWARFHAVQGLNILIVGVAINIVVRLINSVMGLIPYVGPIAATILSIISGAISLGISVISIMGIVYAATGKAMELPVIKAIQIIKK